MTPKQTAFLLLSLMVAFTITAGCISSPVHSTVPGEENLTLHFIAVGQADAILIQQGDTYALVDAGKPIKSDPDATDVLTYLSQQKIKTLDFLLLTHQDYDHIGSAADVLKKYPTNTVYDNGITHTSQTYENLMETIADKNIRYGVLHKDDFIIDTQFENITIHSIWPPAARAKGTNPDINKNSIVLRLVYGTQSAILMGDVEGDTELEIVGFGRTNCISTLIKIGHHGSKASSTKHFLSKINPKYAVITTGENNYGHPAQKTVDRIIDQVGNDNLYLTSSGTVIATTDGIHDWYITQEGF
ncbi:MAG: MBL fold metallo-hydrolase [Methanocorpusculum sp.]|nr:MBL fold metallo-hydrolase [Methanocorpusculum sp.]MDE2524604.1 MBL fold metallo-hydrolase [Methanocorpusculum sp.]